MKISLSLALLLASLFLLASVEANSVNGKSISSLIKDFFCSLPLIRELSFCEEDEEEEEEEEEEEVLTCATGATNCACESEANDCPCTNSKDKGGSSCPCVACSVYEATASCDAGTCEKGGPTNFCRSTTSRGGRRTLSTPMFRNFIGGNLQQLLTPDEIDQISKETAGNLDGSVTLFEKPMMTQEEKETLKSHADSKLTKAMETADAATTARFNRDYSVNLDRLTLETLLTHETFNGLYSAFAAHDSSYEIQLMIIRRTTNDGNNHVKFHTDPEASTMEIWLNDPEDLNTGLAILNRTGVVVTNTTSGLVHSESVIHGVPSFSGTR